MYLPAGTLVASQRVNRAQGVVSFGPGTWFSSRSRPKVRVTARESLRSSSRMICWTSSTREAVKSFVRGLMVGAGCFTRRPPQEF
jgi:hypothetical protein